MALRAIRRHLGALSAPHHRPRGLAVPGRHRVAVAAVVTWFGGWWSAPFWLVAVFVLQFFRDPPREVPAGRGARACAGRRPHRPGGQRAATSTSGRDAVKISVFMNVFNVHSNRSPVDGTVENVWYFPGLFVNADLDKASTDNERNAVQLRTASGVDVTVRAGRRSHRAADPLLRRQGRPARPRAALRLHPLRLAGRRLPAAGLDARRWRSATRSRRPPRSSPSCRGAEGCTHEPARA